MMSEKKRLKDRDNSLAYYYKNKDNPDFKYRRKVARRKAYYKQRAKTISLAKDWIVKNRTRFNEVRNKRRRKENSLNRIRLATWKKWNHLLPQSICCFCGATTELEFHHIKYTVNLSDLLVVCKKCHAKLHRSNLTKELIAKGVVIE